MMVVCSLMSSAGTVSYALYMYVFILRGAWTMEHTLGQAILSTIHIDIVGMSSCYVVKCVWRYSECLGLFDYH